MICVAGQLANVIYMICGGGQGHATAWCLSDHKPGLKHPCVEGYADHDVTLNQKLELFIRELAVPRDQCPQLLWLAMTGPAKRSIA